MKMAVLRRIGFHISIAGGLTHVAARAARIGCTAAQIFTQAPSQWARRAFGREEIDGFRESMARADIAPYFVHAIYLLNLASGDEGLRTKSVAHLGAELRCAGEIGASGVIVHLGSAGRDGSRDEGIARLCASLAEARRESAAAVPLLLENSAGAGGIIGSSFEELRRIIEGSPGAEPLALCFDTAHGFGAGLPLHTEDGLEQALEELNAAPGLERLALVHFNDSRVPFASSRDRHWHIGKGEMGAEAMGRILNHPLLQDVPFIMETPKDGERDDLRNMRTVRCLLHPAQRRLLPRLPRPHRADAAPA